VRVTDADETVEGVLLGWGAKQIVLRAGDERVIFMTDDVVRVEAPTA
jgi:hypothetical protein